MIWFMVLQVILTLVKLVRLGRQSESEKDLEILLMSYVNMLSSSTLRAPNRASINRFPFPEQVAKSMGRCAVAMFLVGSSTTTTATLRRGKPGLA